jgi:hypothetical protein
MCYSCITGKGVMDFPHAWCPNCKSRVAKPRVICNLGIISVENPLPPIQLYRSIITITIVRGEVMEVMEE